MDTMDALNTMDAANYQYHYEEQHHSPQHEAHNPVLYLPERASIAHITQLKRREISAKPKPATVRAPKLMPAALVQSQNRAMPEQDQLPAADMASDSAHNYEQWRLKQLQKFDWTSEDLRRVHLLAINL